MDSLQMVAEKIQEARLGEAVGGFERVEGMAVRLREASSSLSGLSATVESRGRTSENLAYAALTVPRTAGWSWRSFSWGMAAIAVIVVTVLITRGF